MTEQIVDNINYLFIILLALITLATPRSQQKKINTMLCGKFCLFVGAHYFLTHSLGLSDGAYVDIYRAGLDLIFMLGFFYLGGLFLGYICFLMAMFHIFNIYIDFNYFLVMVGFQIVQLLAALGGMIDGITLNASRHNIDYARHQRR